MNTDRRGRLWRLVVQHAQGQPVTVESVCAAMLFDTGLDGSAVTVTLDVGVRETVHASDQIASELAELTLTLGEGPSLDASSGGPVLVADLAAAGSLVRWPAYSPAAAELGARAVFALPMQVGGIRLGVIDLYREKPGPLPRAQVENALMLADTACAVLLDSTQDIVASPDGTGPELTRLQHPEVHQATGMIIAQLGVTAAVALVRLRAHAYANDRRLRDVARDVVARRLRFHPDGPDDGD
jgi:ANTAR domain